MAPPSPLLAVPNVAAHPSTASIPTTVLLYDGPLLCGFNVAMKGLNTQYCIVSHSCSDSDLKAVSIPTVATEYIDTPITLDGRRLALTMQRRRQRRPRITADVIHLRRHDVTTVASVRVAGGNEQVVAVGNHHMIATTLHSQHQCTVIITSCAARWLPQYVPLRDLDF